MDSFTQVMVEQLLENPTEPVDNRPAAKRLYLEQAASRQLSCPDCGTLLDAGDDCTGNYGHRCTLGNTVLFSVDSGRHFCLCTECFDKKAFQFREHSNLEVWDSRERRSYTLPIVIRETAEQTELAI